MTDTFDANFSELLELAEDLGSVPATAGPFIRSAVEVTSRNVKEDAAASVGESEYFGQAAAAIDYEVSTFQGFDASVIQSEIGYNKEANPAGKLGNLREFGAPGSKNALAPSNDLLLAMQNNEDDFQKGLEKALEDAEQVALDHSSVSNAARAQIRGARRPIGGGR